MLNCQEAFEIYIVLGILAGINATSTLVVALMLKDVRYALRGIHTLLYHITLALIGDDALKEVVKKVVMANRAAADQGGRPVGPGA